jgi:hypothetical protein
MEHPRHPADARFAGSAGAARDVKSLPASSITVDTAARLGVYFGMEAGHWLNRQAHDDLARTRETLAASLAAIQTLSAAPICFRIS